MKIGICGDIHLTNIQSKKRLDDYPETQYKKIKYMLDNFKEEKVSCILQPGDLFDSFKSSNFLIQRYISLFKKTNIPIYSIFGNHCLKYHSSDVFDTPLAVLERAGVISIIQNKFNENPKLGDIHLYGCSWGEELPKIIDNKNFNVLLVHKMIVKNEKAWETQTKEQYTKALDMLKNTKFDLIVSGDNHQSFLCKSGNRYLINCGSLMRHEIDQIDHKPHFYVFDILTKELEQFYIPIKNNVFNLMEEEEKKEKTKELEAFIDGLKKDIVITGLKFKNNIINYCKENNIDNNIITIINQSMEA